MSAEYPMIRFLEANGYDVSYQAEADTDRHGSELLNHKVFMSAGHDEYWSGPQRANVEAARDAGVNLAFFSRQRGVLEDPVGAVRRRDEHVLPDARLLQGDGRQREDRSDARPGPARGEIRGSARPRTVGAGERAHGHHVGRSRTPTTP